MLTTNRRTGLLQRMLSRPAPARDAADHGTCFGLELSLDPAYDGPADAPRSALPEWVQRLGQRAKPLR